MDYDQRQALHEVIQYLWDDEELDWEAKDYEKDHIFNRLVTLKAYLDNVKTS